MKLQNFWLSRIEHKKKKESEYKIENTYSGNIDLYNPYTYTISTDAFASNARNITVKTNYGHIFEIKDQYIEDETWTLDL